MASVTIDGLSARDTDALAEMVRLTAGWTEPLDNADIGFAAIDIITREWKRTPAEPNRSPIAHRPPRTRQLLADEIRSRGASGGAGSVQVDDIPALAAGRLAEIAGLGPNRRRRADGRRDRAGGDPPADRRMDRLSARLRFVDHAEDGYPQQERDRATAGRLKGLIRCRARRKSAAGTPWPGGSGSRPRLTGCAPRRRPWTPSATAMRAELAEIDERLSRADTAARTARSVAYGHVLKNRGFYYSPEEYEREAGLKIGKEAEAERLEAERREIQAARDAKREELSGLDERLHAAHAAARRAKAQVTEWHPEG